MSEAVVNSPITPNVFAQIVQESFVAGGEHHAELASTNDLAIQRVGSATEYPLPYLIYTERQTDGRGRGNHKWLATPESLTFSLVTAPDPNIAADRLPTLALSAAVAVAEACQRFIPTGSVKVKWPNDIFIGSEKAGGILIEAGTSRAACVIGIGINVNNRLKDLPLSGRTPATLTAVAGEHIDRSELLRTILDCFAHRWQNWLATPTAPPDWKGWCLLEGKTITIATARGELTGRCLGIDTGGRLLVEENANLHTIASADSIHCHPIKV